MSTVSRIKIPQDFCDPITLDIMIDPIKTNCNHVFSKLPLTAWFREIPAPLCPLCKQRVTSHEPDKELSLKIQKEFLNNQENIEYFKATKEGLKERYSKFTDLSLIPPHAPPPPAFQPAVYYNRQSDNDDYKIDNSYVERREVTLWSTLLTFCKPYISEYN